MIARRFQRWQLTWGVLGLVGVAALGFFAGDRHGRVRARQPGSYHDLRVNHPFDYIGLIQPSHAAVRSLAASLGSAESAYYYVRDQVAFNPSEPASVASETIRRKSASCLGKAALLCSLYRALGASAADVRVVVGEVRYGKKVVDHAWVDIEHGGTCLQQDPTDLLGYFDFGDFRGRAYSKWFAQGESFCFNDKDLALVSSLNRILD